MSVRVNGEHRQLAPGTTAGQLLDQVAGNRRGCAVVVDGEIVRRSDWDLRVLDGAAEIEVITAVQGG